MLKNIFLEVKKKFETAMGILRKEKITIDPNDPAAVAEYARVMKTVREKYDLLTLLVNCCLLGLLDSLDRLCLCIPTNNICFSESEKELQLILYHGYQIC